MRRPLLSLLALATIASAAEAGKPVTLTILGTNDLHGAIERLPIWAGFVANARAARAADGGGVLLVDAGDLFQGTLESNIAEGADVVRAYNALHYDASAVGNHEFDYGPVGPAVTVQKPGDDPRGALIANFKAAKFPFVVANIVDSATGKPPAWPHVSPSVLVERAGVKIGIIGVSTATTPHTTMPANFAGLQMTPAADAIVREAASLRKRGAQVIVVAAHLGSSCKDLADPTDLASCDRAEELFPMLDKIPPGTVDVVVAGHTHAPVAHVIDGVAVIESYSSARAFGRVDLTIDNGRVASSSISQPHDLCRGDKGDHDGPPVRIAACNPGDYEGKPVVADPAIQKIVDQALDRARKRRGEQLGATTLTGDVKRSHASESALGNLFADLMLELRPEASVALTNGGGLRADIPAGPLTYGALYEAMPFDNRFAILDVAGWQLRTLVRRNLYARGGIFSWGGLTATARCVGKQLDVTVLVRGKPLVPSAPYTIVTSDFLASGGDGILRRLKLPPSAVHISDVIIRDAMAELLRKRKGNAAIIDPLRLADPQHRRLDYPGDRPVSCSHRTPKPDADPEAALDDDDGDDASDADAPRKAKP